MAFSWAEDRSVGNGPTVLRPFSEDSDYFEPRTAYFMTNFRVAGPHGLLAELRAEACDGRPQFEESEHGDFGYVIDPEGSKLALWEPPGGRQVRC